MNAKKILIEWSHPTAPEAILIHKGRLTLRQGKHRRFITALEGIGWFSTATQRSCTEGGNVCTGVNAAGLVELVGRVRA